jgi:hypothetical protein
MSGKKPPPTALIRRASPELSDADLAQLLYLRNHLFGRRRLDAMFDPDGRPNRMRIVDENAVEAGASYLIYSETTQRFIGWRRGVVYHLDGSETSRRMRLVFYPAAQA